jgi:methylthioribose-1-phosphate isomerase
MTSITRFETLAWRRDALELLDQRRLPAEQHYVRCTSGQDVADAIRDMVVRGAPAIGCAAAYGVALEALCLAHAGSADFAEGLKSAIERLRASRPTAVNLFWALDRLGRRLAERAGTAPNDIARTLLEEAHAIRAEDVRANRAMGTHGARLLPERARVLTHCNAGALATAGHGTALGVIRSAVEAGKTIEVYADETRPFLQGARLTAWELRQDGIPVTLIADSAAGFLMSCGRVDAVIVGADRVAANGDVANKIGTYVLAVLAQRHAIPFYVACPRTTIDLGVASGGEIPIEERLPEEVLGYGKSRWAPEGVAAMNPVFDVTPAGLVTALITEKGVLHGPNPHTIAVLMREA